MWKFFNIIDKKKVLDQNWSVFRDPISVGTFPTSTESRPRGSAKRIAVRSKCFDASLVIDGSLSFKFNDGTKAIIEILEEDALRTFQLYPGL